MCDEVFSQQNAAQNSHLTTSDDKTVVEPTMCGEFFSQQNAAPNSQLTAIDDKAVILSQQSPASDSHLNACDDKAMVKPATGGGAAETWAGDEAGAGPGSVGQG